MATSLLKIYKDCKVYSDKNFLVESIEDYLSTLNVITISEFQFIRHDLDLEIKVDLSQVYQEFNTNYNYNYVSIKNSNSSRTCYYFVINKTQRADNTIKLTLRMDVLNTFKINDDYTIDDKTLVLREHKDRLQKFDIGLVYKPTTIYEGIISTSIDYTITTYEGRNAVRFEVFVGMLVENYKKEYELIQNGLNTYEIYVDYDYSNYKVYLYAIGTLQDMAYFNYNFILKEYMPLEEKIFRKIDFYEEGINPTLYKVDSEIINQGLDVSWNLIYKNNQSAFDPSTEAEAIDCYLLPDNPLRIEYTGSPSASISAYSFTDNTYNIFQNSYNGEIIFVNGTKQYKVYEESKTFNGQTTTYKYVVVFYRVGQALTLEYYELFKSYLGVYNKKLLTSESINTGVQIINCPEELKYFEATSDISEWVPATTNASISFASDQEANLISISQYDKTEPSLIKIIKLPYCPTSYEYNESTGIYKFNTNWIYTASTLKLYDLNVKFDYTFNSEINPFEKLTSSVNDSIILGRLRNDDFETKIYNSEFYYNKFVYDSFGFVFRLEAINQTELLKAYDDAFKIRFITTSTINSKFAFIFPQYILKYSNEDFDNVLTIARNNEVSIYNSQYLNYVRNGFNYDLKALERSKRLTGLNVATSVIGGATSAIIGVSTGSPLTAISSVVGASSSITSSIVNGIETIKAQEENMERRQRELMNQATSVSGSDDLDLMIAYSLNRAYINTYEVSARMKQCLLDLFYYCGYATNERKIPDITTRTYFNYLQADLEVEENYSSNIPENLMTRIKELFKGGITILHKVNNNWDFEQQLENFETSLF